MEFLFNIVREFLNRTPVTFGDLILSLTIVGLILIAVNAYSHYLRERISDDVERKRKRKEIVENNLKPLIDATSSVIVRLMEILVYYYPEIIDDINKFDARKFNGRISEICKGGKIMNRHESSAYRLLHFFHHLKQFERETKEIPDYKLLKAIRYFTEHKIPVGLRGKLYGFKCLSTQIQDRLSSLFFEQVDGEKDVDITVSSFLSLLGKSHTLKKEFLHPLNFINVDISPLRNNQPIRADDNKWKQILALCHLSVYLIDFCQDLDNNPQWEEYRVYLVRLIKQWNQVTTNRNYLYRKNDLDTSDYIDTFHDTCFMAYPTWRRIIRFAWTRRRHKFCALRRRGKRFVGRHDRKKVDEDGVVIYSNENKSYTVDWNEDLPSLRTAIRNYLVSEKNLSSEKLIMG